MEIFLFVLRLRFDYPFVRATEMDLIRFLSSVDGLVLRIMHNILVAYYKFIRCDGARH